MSRLRLLAQNVSSGYAQLAANTCFTLVSVPLALHYLSREEFGLWTLVMQVVGYLVLVDLGMTGAIGRVLIDHKDHPAAGGYGSVVRTGWLVLVLQGALIAALSVVAGFALPGLLEVPAHLSQPFQWLVTGNGLFTGALFFHRMFGCVLQAHQRHDVVNYAQAGSLVVNLAVLWAGFHLQLGLNSLLVAQVAGIVFMAVAVAVAAHRLRLMPPQEARGRLDAGIFRELFLFGGDVFLLSVGLQLVNASQVVVISRTLGLEAAAVWSVATKAFVMAQQMVWRLWDFSSSTIAEMIVRDERARLRRRFEEIVLVTATLSVFAGLGVAVCNGGLLAVWTRGRISWDPLNDWLMAVLFLTNSVTRLHVGLLGPTKQIGGMRWIYFFEGVSFVTLAFFAARWWGLPGMIAVAIAMNLLWTGLYGTWRTAKEFGVPFGEVAWRWLWPAIRYAAVLAPVAVLDGWLARTWPPWAQLAGGAAVMGSMGAVLLWHLGLTPALRAEMRGLAARACARFGVRSPRRV